MNRIPVQNLEFRTYNNLGIVVFASLTAAAPSRASDHLVSPSVAGEAGMGMTVGGNWSG